MKKLLFIACAVLASHVAQAATVQNNNPTDEYESLAPTEADMAKARADRKAGKQQTQHEDSTRITAVRDANNKVVQYVVEPGNMPFKYKYRVDNQFDRPIDTGPGGHSRSTLGTTKILQIGW